MSPEFYLARVYTHRRNIIRYRAILTSNLTPLERSFVERRIADEEAALQTLAGRDIPRAPASENESIERNLDFGDVDATYET